MSWIRDFFSGNFKYYFAYFAIILFFILLFLEIALRYLTFSSGTGLGSANQRWEDKYWTPINELGYRDYEVLADDPRPSIIFLGDSFTAGHGIKFDETFYHFIHESLDPNFRAINIGKSGASTIQEKNNLMNLVTAVRPSIDTIVVQYFGNDIDNYVKIPQHNKNVFRVAMSRISELYSFIDSIYFSTKWTQNYMDSLLLGYQDEDIMRKHFNDLNAIISIARKEDAKVIFIAMPYLNNYYLEKSQIYISQLKENFVNICENDDYFIDISPLAKSFKTRMRVVNFMDAHASPKLNSAIGVLLKKVLAGIEVQSDKGVLNCTD